MKARVSGVYSDRDEGGGEGAILIICKVQPKHYVKGNNRFFKLD